MSERAKRGKTETLVLPVAGKVAVVVIAVAALGYGLLLHPPSVRSRTSGRNSENR
jgi:hypothetical protein